jgi:hypothetical protein
MKDSRFEWVTKQMKNLGPGPERTQIVDEFWSRAYDYFVESEREMIRVRGRVLSDDIGMLDEERLERERASGPHQYRVSQILKGERPYYGPSHVVEGGGDSLQECLRDVPIPPICTQNAHDEMDRSSPAQSQRFRAGLGPSQC